jgi:glutathione S-transferase
VPAGGNNARTLPQRIDHWLQEVRHCLREKGLPYKSRYVELWRYENLSPAYLALNPNGVVPTLRLFSLRRALVRR